MTGGLVTAAHGAAFVNTTARALDADGADFEMTPISVAKPGQSSFGIGDPQIVFV